MFHKFLFLSYHILIDQTLSQQKFDKFSAVAHETNRTVDGAVTKRMDDDVEIPGTRTLVRGLEVLVFVSEAREPPKFNDIHAHVKMTKASLHRLLAALHAQRFIRYDPQVKRYAIGSRVFDVTRRSHDVSNLMKSAKPELARLSRDLNLVVCLYVRDADQVFVLDFEDVDASRVRINRTWPILPLFESAPGQAILSAIQRPAKTITDRFQDLTLTKALGYSVVSDVGSGRTYVAAPIRNADGHPEGALCCEFITSSIEPTNAHECGRVVSEAARRASANTGLRHITPHIMTTPPRPLSDNVELLETGRDYMGENPVWNAKTQTLYWLDILAPALRWYVPGSKEIGHIVLPEVIGGMAMDQNDDLVMLGHGGVYRWDPGNRTLNLLINPEASNSDVRFNTVGVDHSGSIWSGTQSIDNTASDGKLYRIGSGLSFEVMSNDISLPKNPTWSPDGRTLYVSSGGDGSIWAFDLESGRIETAGRKLIIGNDDIGYPNGLAIDTDGGIWAAMVGSWSVIRFKPDGSTDKRITVPVPMPTGLAFGGADNRQLFITSSFLRLPPGLSHHAPNAGKLLVLDVPEQGAQQFRFG